MHRLGQALAVLGNRRRVEALTPVAHDDRHRVGLDLGEPDLSDWDDLLERMQSRRDVVEIALVGKYVKLQDAYLSVHEALKHAGWADIVMCFGPQARQDFFRDTPRLKWVHSLGTGTDGITDSPHLGKDVVVTAVRGIHGAPISEMAFLMMLAFNRDLRRIERQRAEKKWERWPGLLLKDKTVGILGVGAIAEDLAPRPSAP